MTSKRKRPTRSRAGRARAQPRTSRGRFAKRKR